MADNEHLVSWQRHTGLSNRALAQLIAEASRKTGRPMRANPTQVAAWRSGQQPRAHTAALIATVITARAGRAITPLDLGFTAGTETDRTAAPASGSALDDLAHAGTIAEGRTTMDRRSMIKAGLAAGVSVSAAMQWLLPDSARQATAGSRVAERDVDALWSSARALLAEDNRYGGRAVRPKALQLLNTVATPMLTGRFTDDRLGRQAAAAVAYSGHLAAWTCMDDGDLVSAQTLMASALKLAKQADDPIVAAGILTDMAHLEHLAGQPHDGVLLARAAQAPGPTALPGPMLARAAAMEARCHAKLGDRNAMHTAAGRAEDHLQRARQRTDPHPLDFFFDHQQLHNELHVAYRDLVIAGAAEPDTLLDHMRLIGPAPHMGRRAAMVAADTAIAHLIAGDYDAGHRQAHTAITAAAPLHGGSGRVLGSLRRIRPQLARYTATSGDARDLDTRLRAAAPARLAV